MTNIINYRNLIVAALLIIGVVAAGAMTTPCLASHPYHVSRAEMNWNPNSGNFEVALCLWPADLEKAIGIDQGQPVDLDKVENLDAMLQQYIAKKFLVRAAPAEGAAAQQPNANIRWVGHEKTMKEAWLYFEIKGEQAPAKWTIENRVFFELNDDQLNQIQLTNVEKFGAVICARSQAKHGFTTRKTENGRTRLGQDARR
jgi:hypothetical protein